MAKKVYSVDDAPTYSKVDKVYVVNPEGGGGGGGPVPLHNHDDRYYTKEQIDGSINHVAETLQGRVKTSESDTPDFLVNKVDNVTLSVEGNELKVKSVDGMHVGVAQLNAWLSGTDGNIQDQIDGILGTLTAMSSGMRYRGKFETHAELTGIGNMDGGDLAVVLADETRDGARSLYVYNESLGYWDFVGAFEFSDEFIALSDTPSSYAGADGKYVRVDETNGKLVFDVVDYGNLANKPTATITQIDDAVMKRHEHVNKSVLDGVSESVGGILTYKGEEYVRKTDLPAHQKKQRLFAYRSGSDQPLTAGTDCVFNTKHSGDIPYDMDTGIFTLEAGKLYRVEVAGSLFTSGWVILQLVNAETNSIVNPIARGIWMDVNPSNENWHESSAGPLKTYVTPTSTREYKIRATSVSGESSLRSNFISLEIAEI